MKYQKMLRLGLCAMASAINVHAQKIGEKVAFDDSEWTVLSAKNAGSAVEPKSPFGKSATTEGNFIFVVYKVKNTTKREKSILVTPVLVDSESREFNPYRHQANYLEPSAETITLEALPANIPKTYHAMYEVPAESKGLKFQVRSLSIMTEYKLVSLGFDEAKAYQEAKIAFREAQAAFEKAISEVDVENATSEVDVQKDAKYGGVKFEEMMKHAKFAQSLGDDPEKGVQSYKAALALLPSVIAELTENKRLLLVAALTAAREAKDGGEWKTCVDKAKEVLILDPSNTEARTLKDSASNAMMDAAIAAALTAAREAKNNKQWQVCMEKIKEVLTKDSKNIEARNLLALTAAQLIPGEAWKSPAAGMEFVWISALKIWVGKYEVTNNEYRKKAPAHESKESEKQSMNGERQPVVYVNFDDAVAYAAWLTEKDKAQLSGMRYRVPAETEWLAFAQCGDGREYPWGNNMPPKYGNYSNRASEISLPTDGYKDGYVVSSPVEQSGKNEWGLYGVGGNAWECCASDESGSSFGSWRGAAWDNNNSKHLRCEFRNEDAGSYRGRSCGFRLVLSR